MIKRWLINLYHKFSKKDTWTDEYIGITFASSDNSAFNLIAPKKVLKNPPKDLDHDSNHREGLVLKAELVRAGYFDEQDQLDLMNGIRRK